jgi:hypothetical protein
MNTPRFDDDRFSTGVGEIHGRTGDQFTELVVRELRVRHRVFFVGSAGGKNQREGCEEGKEGFHTARYRRGRRVAGKSRVRHLER